MEKLKKDAENLSKQIDAEGWSIDVHTRILALLAKIQQV